MSKFLTSNTYTHSGKRPELAVQHFIQVFYPEMLDAELDFAKSQHFIQVFYPEMLDAELDFGGRPYSARAKTGKPNFLRKRDKNGIF